MAVAALSGLVERRRRIGLKAECDQRFGRAARTCALVPTDEVWRRVDVAVLVGDHAAVSGEDESERYAVGVRETHCLVASAEAVECGVLDEHECSLKPDCKGMHIIA
jgi:hypothetical protein